MGKRPNPLFSNPTISPMKAEADKQAHIQAPKVIIKCNEKYNLSLKKQ